MPGGQRAVIGEGVNDGRAIAPGKGWLASAAITAAEPL
jgi:hypothetical protein